MSQKITITLKRYKKSHPFMLFKEHQNLKLSKSANSTILSTTCCYFQLYRANFKNQMMELILKFLYLCQPDLTRIKTRSWNNLGVWVVNLKEKSKSDVTL